jgi:2,3-bisphosphoglycerate-independent phosphoglycerate mutase
MIILTIMDGFGIAPAGKDNAITMAGTPNIDKLLARFPHTELGASGLDVGLPEGQMGNSEVGHLNIGAGRVVYQDLTHISKEIKDGTFFSNEVLAEAMQSAITGGKKLHVMGLLGPGGVHSYVGHLHALIEMAKLQGADEVFIHCFLDGRDVPPSSAAGYIRELQHYIQIIGKGKIASVCGRYYAMDRDNRWDRVEKAYNMLTMGEGVKATDPAEAVEASYANGVTDEFVLPTVITDAEGNPSATIGKGDSVIFFNFRPDRAREITRALSQKEFEGFERKTGFLAPKYVCFTRYDATFNGVQIAFKPRSLKNTLGEYLASLGKKQLRIAETEKYAHVTFFFNGGVEAPNEGEDRPLVPSPKVATYDMQPEMSAYEVKDKVVEAIKSEKYDVIILNFANCDMVGHTGIFEAAEKAVRTVDECVGEVAEAVLSVGGLMLLTADHGNADHMFDESGPFTAHTTNPVPLVLIGDCGGKTLDEGGKLCDIAPTMLDLIGLPIPSEMTGRSLKK